MENKHELNQYKLNNAKSFARAILEDVSKVELLFHLSQEGHLENEKAENGIINWIGEIENNTKELMFYLTPKKKTNEPIHEEEKELK